MVLDSDDGRFFLLLSYDNHEFINTYASCKKMRYKILHLILEKINQLDYTYLLFFYT